jgi:hypothetical protein
VAYTLSNSFNSARLSSMRVLSALSAQASGGGTMLFKLGSTGRINSGWTVGDSARALPG